jgi:ABC-type multidrug transport system fused ATPase/permease subunit
MKIKVLSLNTKTALATAVYYLAIVVLLVLLGMIVLRFVFSPPCSIIAKNECVVDGWSVAGLAGTVLAVAATLLAVLGAIAVAYWWLSLNEKVDRRVDEQIKTAIDQALKEQEKKISDQTTHLLQEQEKKFGETFSNTQKEMDTLKELASDIERRVEGSIEQLIIAITQLDPWIIEQWASEYMLLSPLSGVAARMVRKYLQFVDGFFPSDPNDVSAIAKHLESLKNRSAPSQNPIYYWEKALAWQREINPQLQPTYAETARYEIEKRRVNMELWKKQRGL